VGDGAMGCALMEQTALKWVEAGRRAGENAWLSFGSLVLHVVLDRLFPVERGAGVGRALAAGGTVLEWIVRRGCGFRLGNLGFDGGRDTFGAEGTREFALLELDTFSGEALGSDDKSITLEGDLARGGSTGGLGGEDFVLEQVREAAIEEVDFHPEYIAAITRFVDLDAIRASGYRFLIDDMYGAGRGVIAGIFTRAGVPFVEIRSEINPAFPGINPEPILPNIAETQVAVVREKCDAGLIADGDADRIGAVDEHGNVVDAHKILSVLAKWLLERKKWPGDLTRAFNTTKMVDRIAAKYGRKLHEHGIGFKYVVELMLAQEILIGGEESGGVGISRHLPERDGLLNALLLANVMADEKKTLGQLVAALQEEFGEHQYGRVDMHIDDGLKQSAIARAGAVQAGAEMAGMKVLRVETMDGIKFFLENPDCAGKPHAAETWLLLRASGTEPLLRVYCESCSTESVTRVLQAAKVFVLQGRAV